MITIPNKSQWLKAIFIVVILVGFFAIKNAANDGLEEVPLTTVISNANAGEVSVIVQTGNRLEISKEGDNFPTQSSTLEEGTSLVDAGLDTTKTDLIIEDEPVTENRVQFAANIILSLIPIAVIIGAFVFLFKMLQHNQKRAGTNKNYWTVILLFGGLIIGSLIYYFMVYRQDR